MEYTAQFAYDCVWLVDGEKRVCTGGHESDGYPCLRLFSVKRPIIAQARIAGGNNSATHTNTFIHRYL